MTRNLIVGFARIERGGNDLSLCARSTGGLGSDKEEDRESKRDRDGAKLTGIFERVELVEKPAGSS